jgi:hypothetical protein
MPILKEDKVSKGKNRVIYSKKGEQVTIISVHDQTLIVENVKTKVRFSVTSDEIKD